MSSLEHPSLYDRRRAPAYYRCVVWPIFLLLSPVIIPVRLAVFMALVGLSAAFDWLLDLGTDRTRPLAPWRLHLYRLNKLVLYRAALLACGYVVVVRGRRNDKVRVLACNHQSQVDILVGASAGASCVVAKAAVARSPLFGPTLRVTRSLLARGGDSQAAFAARLTEEPQAFPPLAVFPAGTTTNQRLLPRYRSGVFTYGPTVQLATMHYHTYGRVFYTCGSAAANVWRLLSNVLTVVEMRFHARVFAPEPGETP